MRWLLASRGPKYLKLFWLSLTLLIGLLLRYPHEAPGALGDVCDLPPGQTFVEASTFVYPVGNQDIRPTDIDFDPNGYMVTQRFTTDGHTGVDLATRNNAAGGTVRAIAYGRVVYRQEKLTGWGYMVRVEHRLSSGQFVYSQYAHLLADSLRVNCGDTVVPGDIIGNVGSSGNSTNPHLHLEIKLIDTNGCGYLPDSRCATESFSDFLDPLEFIAEQRNQPPTVTSLSANPTSVSPGGTSQLALVSSDQDNDPLTYLWSATGGTLSATTGPGPITWTAPATPGVYTVTVSVTDNKPGHSPVSQSVSIAVILPPPGPIQFFSVSGSCSGTSPQISLSWSSSSGATVYQVFRNGSFYANVGTSLSFTDTAVAAGVNYSYFIRASNASGSTDSNTVPFTAPTCAFNFTLSNSGNIAVVQGSSGSNTITKTLVSGSSEPVTLSVSGLPTGATPSFTNNPCSPSCSSTLTISTSASTPTGTFPITVTGSPLNKATTFNLIVQTAPLPQAQLSLGPLIVNFESVQVGTCATAQFAIQHVLGTAPASGTVSASPNPPFSIPSGATFSVSNGAGHNVTVQFCPGSVGTFNGTATVSSSATFTNTNTVQLTGSGFFPPTELITNGGFEFGSFGWALSGNFQADSRFSFPHTGSGYAYLANFDGTAGNNLNGTMHQTFIIPFLATSVTLSFWYNVTSQETTSFVPFDVLNVTIQTAAGSFLATVAVISNLDKGTAGVYRQKTFDLTPFRGQTVRLHFLGTTDSSLPTTFRIDDVSIVAR